MSTSNLGDEFEGLVNLAEAVFGIPINDEGEPIAREEHEIVELVRLVQIALTKLPEREYSVVSMRFGLGAFLGRRHSLEEVAEQVGVTRERVRQIEQKMLARLRSSVRDE